MSSSETVTVISLIGDKTRSIAKVVLDGLNDSVRNTECRLTYEVLCGEGLMIVDGEYHELRPGVSVTVETGQSYQDMGRLSMLATSEPPFYAEQVEVAEPQVPLCFSDEIALASQAAQVVV